MTREDWLQKATKLLRPIFRDRANLTIPKNVRIAVGFTSKGARSNRIGECWQSVASADNHYEIFIVPTLTDYVETVGVLVHELLHASLPAGTKHGKRFKAAADMLDIPMVAKNGRTEPAPAFRSTADMLLKELGPLPHAALVAGSGSNGPK